MLRDRYFSLLLILGMVFSFGKVSPPFTNFPLALRNVSEEAPVSSDLPAQRRLALVIGNANYGPGNILSNPVNDARDMKSALIELGFDVMAYENCDMVTMKQVIDNFGERLAASGYDEGLFYYAGHGIQVDGVNYLVPVGAKLRTEQQVEYQCVRADRVLGEMEASRTSVNLLILDACRDNPFERSWRRAQKGAGLASMDAPSGTLIAYATAPGSTASDGGGRNGLYTAAILEKIRTPGLSIYELFQEVRNTVLRRSGEKQKPWESVSLTRTFYFNEGTAPPFPYRTRTFNGLTWMTQNLNVEVPDSWCYDDDPANCAKFGRLYTWEAAKRACASLGQGWRLPTDEEWRELAQKFGGYYDVPTSKDVGDPKASYKALLEGGNSSFNARLGGYRSSNGSFDYLGGNGGYWSATERDGDDAWGYGFRRDNGELSRGWSTKSNGPSCRCVQD